MSKRRGKNKRKLNRVLRKPIVRVKTKSNSLYDEWFEYLRVSGLTYQDRHLKATKLSNLKVPLYFEAA